VDDTVADANDNAIRVLWLGAAREVVQALQQKDAVKAWAHHQRLRDMGELFRIRRISVDELLQLP